MRSPRPRLARSCVAPCLLAGYGTIDGFSLHAAVRGPQPATKPRRDDFRGGERITFEDRSGQAQVGSVAGVHRQTATIHTDDGKIWRVSFSLLRHIVDV